MQFFDAKHIDAMQANAMQAGAMQVEARPSLAGPSDAAAAARHATRRARLVAGWLWCVAALVFATVLVGGATRLTQSGLSIVEWQPVTGVVPPLSDADWRAAFAQYRAIPQYQRVNSGMSLDEFKSIYWWEWAHRMLGRVIGVVFLVPFLWFLWRGWVDRRLGLALTGLFALGAVQGAVGWWMVASGLAERVSVSQYRLAFHLTLACAIYAVLVWTADGILAPARASRRRPVAANRLAAADETERAAASDAPLRRRHGIAAGALLVLVLAQIYLGALVAGLHAGSIYNTWPLIDGSIVPAARDLLFGSPPWRNFFENTLTVQFDHRMLAYTLGVVALLHAFDVSRNDRGGALAGSAGLVTVAIFAQVMVGVVTLVHAAPIGLSLIHQAMALVVLTAATLHAARTSGAWTWVARTSVARTWAARAPGTTQPRDRG
jgi:cytochrome c oxidase assembly protein subunit 15